MTITDFYLSFADSELVALARDGNDAAFSSLVERYQELIAKVMWRFAHETTAHEELVHEVFVQVYLSLAKYRGDAPFSHYLTALASRVGYGFWRQKTRDRTCALPENFADTRIAPPDTAIRETDSPSLFSLLEKLPPEDRVVLTLTYYEEKNAKEIATMLGWTHTATRMRLTRARRKLQKIAKKNGLSWEN